MASRRWSQEETLSPVQAAACRTAVLATGARRHGQQAGSDHARHGVARHGRIGSHVDDGQLRLGRRLLERLATAGAGPTSGRWRVTTVARILDHGGSFELEASVGES